MKLATVALGALICILAVMAACAQGNLPQPVQNAVADLAQRLNVGQDAITVASFEEVTWPDAALGNPQPGEIYAQVQTPGYRVFLSAQGERYEYHTDMGARVTLVNPSADDAPDDGAMTTEQEARARIAVIERAKQHLAMRLDVEPGAIYLGAIEERTWSSSALGVEQPGEMYAQVMTPGYRLVLEARGQLYDYHTDLSAQVKPAGLVEPGADGDAGGDAVQAERPPSVDAAIADLAGRLNVEPQGIAVERVEQAQWPNGALGLPEPGMMYTQAIVPGHRVLLRAKGRVFAYHTAGESAVRYAGVVYPEDAEVSVLALSRTEPTDGNNFFHLHRINPDTGQRRTLMEFVADFAATPDGRDLLVKRRTSRSSHLLMHVGPDGTPTDLGGAFDYHGMALRPDGEMVACWARPSVVDRDAYLTIRVRPWAQEMPIQPPIPGVQPGEFTTGMLVWTDEGLAFTVRTDVGARSFYWTRDGGIEELGAFAVMGWIPRTRALLIRRAEDNREVLAAFIPGMGESAVLTNVPSLQSVDAPVGQDWVVAAVSGGGAPEIQTITWGGNATKRYDLQDTERAVVRVSPLGDVVVAEYLQGDANRTSVMGLTGGLETQTLEDAAGAVPVVD